MVFVVAPNDKAVQRPVTIGLRSGDLLGLTSGVTDGERVVTEGQLTLTDGAQVAADATGAPKK